MNEEDECTSCYANSDAISFALKSLDSPFSVGVTIVFEEGMCDDHNISEVGKVAVIRVG